MDVISPQTILIPDKLVNVLLPRNILIPDQIVEFISPKIILIPNQLVKVVSSQNNLIPDHFLEVLTSIVNFIPYNVLNSDRLVDVIFPQQIIINYQLSARTISNLSSYQCGPEKTLDEENPTALRFLAAHSERLFNSLQILP